VKKIAGESGATLLGKQVKVRATRAVRSYQSRAGNTDLKNFAKNVL